MIHSLSRIAIVFLFVLALAGCGSKINQANFDKIATDMSRHQVEAILGSPAETSSTDIGIASGGSSTWKDENGAITVQFLNDKVVTKTFSATQK